MAEATEAPRAEKPTYHRDRLIAEAPAFFSQPSFVVAGALASVRKQQMTRDEADKAVRDYLTRPAEMSYGHDEGGE